MLPPQFATNPLKKKGQPPTGMGGDAAAQYQPGAPAMQAGMKPQKGQFVGMDGRLYNQRDKNGVEHVGQTGPQHAATQAALGGITWAPTGGVIDKGGEFYAGKGGEWNMSGGGKGKQQKAAPKPRKNTPSPSSYTPNEQDPLNGGYFGGRMSGGVSDSAPDVPDGTKSSPLASYAPDADQDEDPYMMQRGGRVPGKGSGDKVPALLEPGEFVLNKKAAKMVGRDKLEKINNAGKPKGRKNKAMCMGGKVKKMALGGGIGDGFFGAPVSVGGGMAVNFASLETARQNNAVNDANREAAGLPRIGMKEGGEVKDPEIETAAATHMGAALLNSKNKNGRYPHGHKLAGSEKESLQRQQELLAETVANQPDDVRDRARQHVQGKPALPPKFIRGNPKDPNSPSGPAAQHDAMTGKLTRAGVAPHAKKTYREMNERQDARKAMAKQAVTDKRKSQIDDVAGTVDRSRAARAEVQAQSGIADLGGGNKTLNNKYGSGFVTTGNKPRALGSKPGAVRDENGPVDMKKTVATGKVVNTKENPMFAPTRSERMGEIAKGQAALATGAADRLAADRATDIARVQTRVNVNAAKDRLAASGAPVVRPTQQTVVGNTIMDTPGASSEASKSQGLLRNVHRPAAVAAKPATPATVTPAAPAKQPAATVPAPAAAPVKLDTNVMPVAAPKAQAAAQVPSSRQRNAPAAPQGPGIIDRAVASVKGFGNTVADNIKANVGGSILGKAFTQKKKTPLLATR